MTRSPIELFWTAKNRTGRPMVYSCSWPAYQIGLTIKQIIKQIMMICMGMTMTMSVIASWYMSLDTNWLCCRKAPKLPGDCRALQPLEELWRHLRLLGGDHWSDPILSKKSSKLIGKYWYASRCCGLWTFMGRTQTTLHRWLDRVVGMIRICSSLETLG